MKLFSIPFSWEPKLNYTFVSLLSVFEAISGMKKLHLFHYINSINHNESN